MYAEGGQNWSVSVGFDFLRLLRNLNPRTYWNIWGILGLIFPNKWGFILRILYRQIWDGPFYRSPNVTVLKSKYLKKSLQVEQGWCTPSRLRKSGLSFSPFWASKNMLSKLSGLQEVWSVKLAESWQMLEFKLQIWKSSGSAECLGSAVGEQSISRQKISALKCPCTKVKQKAAQTLS